MMEPKELKAVLFDLGGTLICYPPQDIQQICQNYWQQIGVKKEILLKMWEIHEKTKQKYFPTLKEPTLTEAFQAALSWAGRYDLDPKEILKNLHYFLDVRASYLYEGARETLKTVKEELNLKIGLISNTCQPGELKEKELERFEILEFFETIIWSSEFGYQKPHLGIFFEALHRLKVEPSEAIFVGDDYWRDIQGANRIGMPAIWISQEEKREFYGWQVKKLKEVIEIIKEVQR